MQMPSKTCTRWRWPSMTLKCTRSVSPALNWGNSRSWRRSMSSMTVMTGWSGRKSRGMVPDPGRASQVRPGPAARLLLAPARHLAVVAGEEHGRHRPAAELLRPGVMRVLGPALERLGEGVLKVALVAPEGARELAGDGVEDGHRGHLAAREHVRPDRDRVIRELVVHALVEALVAAAQERHALERGELRHDLVAELAPDRRQHRHPALCQDAPDGRGVDALERCTDDVDPDHHPRSAAVRGVVHLPVATGGVVAQVEHAQAKRARVDRVCDRARPAHPVEMAREERDDIELERHRKSSRTPTTRPTTSTCVTTSSTNGTNTGPEPRSEERRGGKEWR